MRGVKIQNFGKNYTFSPKYYFEPESENEVLKILNEHRFGTVRVTGSGHAWNKGIESDDVFLEIKKLNHIRLDGEVVDVGGGTKLKDLISYLTKRNLMVPAMGGIMQQSVAGLASTSTHGTGNSSFSHHIISLRVAAFEKTNSGEIKAKIFEYTEGEELKAARTSVGCMGVILSMKIKCIPRYFIEEKSRLVSTIKEVIDNEKDWPLGQTVILPYSWNFFIFGRRKVSETSMIERLRASIERVSDYINIEILPHVILKVLLRINDFRYIISYYKSFLPKMLFSVRVINEDYVGLTLHTKHHYYFRHVEMEIFIKEKDLTLVYEVIKNVVSFFAGLENNLSQKYQDELKDMHGKYVLHYPMFIRKVYPDDTLISMTADGEARYAIGFFTYREEKDRGSYYTFTKALAEILSRDYGVRIHWGKHFPLDFERVKSLYPQIEKFKDICREVDPNGVFHNDFIKKIFGF